MKRTIPILLLFALSIPVFLSSCSDDITLWNDDPALINEPISDEITVAPTDTTAPSVSEEKKTEWVAAGEQTNLAPSDTPRGIAEGGLYLPFTPTALAQASDDIVLFFYASWSPASITTHKDIIAKKATLLKDLTLLQVNFDDSDTMKQQYGVTEQNTFVQVTNTGELIKKWRGANSLEDIVKQIQK